MKKLGAILILVTLILSGCDNGPVFPNEPEISFVSITPENPTQFTTDEITLTIHYQDGDGDLGHIDQGNGEPRLPNIFLTDSRAVIHPDCTFKTVGYIIPNLTPDTRKPSIQGDISITLTTPPHHTFIDPFSDEEPLIFEVYLVDRAGNISNTIKTDPITIQQ